MSYKLITSDGQMREGDTWPLPGAPQGGGIPKVSSWRQWGMSWAAAGFDQQSGKERNRTRITERIGGLFSLGPSALQNEAVSGSAVMPAYGIGFGRVLQRCAPRGRQEWPWEVDRFGVEAVMYGVNDIGDGGIVNSGSYWNGQGAMWQLVWGNTLRSIISRFIAGAVYAAKDTSGFAPGVWHSTTVPPSATGTSDFAFVPQGPGGVGLGGWQFKLDTTVNSGKGYWWTPNNGDRILCTVPVDYGNATGITLRHLCPGSWFDGPVANRDPFGVDNSTAATPNATQGQCFGIRTGAEHVRSPSALTVTGPGLSATVDCRGLANRQNKPGSGVAGTPGTIPPEGAMTHVSRHMLTPTPGTTQQVVLTVGGLAGAGAWYGFDSFEIEADPLLRPYVLMSNVADPANWGALYGFAPASVWALTTAQAQAYSDVLAGVVGEFADPGIAVVDIRTALAANPIDYAELVDTHLSNPNVPVGDIVESSGTTLLSPHGDGTHPHAIGEKLIVGAHLDTLAGMDVPRGRAAIPFAPGRDLAYARSTSQ